MAIHSRKGALDIEILKNWSIMTSKILFIRFWESYTHKNEFVRSLDERSIYLGKRRKAINWKGSWWKWATTTGIKLHDNSIPSSVRDQEREKNVKIITKAVFSQNRTDTILLNGAYRNSKNSFSIFRNLAQDGPFCTRKCAIGTQYLIQGQRIFWRTNLMVPCKNYFEKFWGSVGKNTIALPKRSSLILFCKYFISLLKTVKEMKAKISMLTVIFPSRRPPKKNSQWSYQYGGRRIEAWNAWRNRRRCPPVCKNSSFLSHGHRKEEKIHELDSIEERKKWLMVSQHYHPE